MDIIEKQDLEGEQQYNTQREKLWMPEYGRNVQKMVEYLKTIEDREKRNEQARAVVKVMEILNPQVHLQENYEQKLWDHLQIISGFTLDIDSPYPAPSRERFHERPTPIPIEKKPIRATHYGRNIESIIDLIVTMEDGVKTGGIGTAITEYAKDKGYKGEVIRIGVPDEFIGHGSVSELYAECGMDAASVTRAIREALKRQESKL